MRVQHLPHEERLSTVLAWLFLSGISVICALPRLSRLPWMIFVQDDLLYYLKVAQNIASGHGSTFNGLVATNGYQPLWLLLLVALSYATISGPNVLVLLGAITFAASVATFLLSRLLLGSTAVRPLLTFALSGLVTIYSLTLFFYGMEVTLTVPIILGVLCLLQRLPWIEQSIFHAFGTGLLLSAMVLSRIDTLIFGSLLLTGILATPSLRTRLRPPIVTGVLLGFLPVLIYFEINHRIFHTWLPVSGMAKELKFNHNPSIEPWRVFFHSLAAGFAILLLIGVFLAFRLRRSLDDIQPVLYLSVLTFPFIYYFVLCCVSDWTLWGWYMYPIRLGLCVTLLLLCLWRPAATLMQLPAVTSVLVISVFVVLAFTRWRLQQADIYAASVDIQQFAQTHPGIYAMGDRAGRVAMMIQDPIVQTEGLMMDRNYLEFVRKQTPLRETLAHYGVSYYVATAYEPYTGCFQAIEPAKAGPDSAHMRGVFCEAPTATYLHEGIKTLIFDLRSTAH